MMNKLLMTALMMACTGGLQARNWTNAEGKTVAADLVRVNGDQVVLKVHQTGRTHTFDISKLSEEDQEYIADFQEENAATRAMTNREAKWHESLDDAQEESRQLELPMLVLITAPELHPGCEMLEDKVLKKSGFKRFANSNLVLHLVDFSERSVLTEWEKKNPEMAKKCAGFGVPRVFFIDSNGGVLGSLGYERESVDEYLKKIGAIINR